MVVTDRYEYLCEEEKRLKEDRERKKYWKQFGSYVHIPMNPSRDIRADHFQVSERQWATGRYCLLATATVG